MTDRQALLRAVLHQPADDTARLVYADHLDDYPGHPLDPLRAGLIRFMVAHPDVRVVRSDGGWGAVPGRVLTPAWWVAMNGFLSEPLPEKFRVERGFVSDVWLPRASMLTPTMAAEIGAAHPVTAVWLEDRHPLQEAWFRDDGFAHPWARNLGEEVYAVAAPVFDLLPGLRRGQVRKHYAQPMSVLARAAANHCRQQADLPLLPREVG